MAPGRKFTDANQWSNAEHRNAAVKASWPAVYKSIWYSGYNLQVSRYIYIRAVGGYALGCLGSQRWFTRPFFWLAESPKQSNFFLSGQLILECLRCTLIWVAPGIDTSPFVFFSQKLAPFFQTSAVKSTNLCPFLNQVLTLFGKCGKRVLPSPKTNQRLLVGFQQPNRVCFWKHSVSVRWKNCTAQQSLL